MQVKKVAAREWISAGLDSQLNPGDLVRTGAGATAEIRFANGGRMRMRADSVLVIEGERSPGISGSDRPPSP